MNSGELLEEIRRELEKHADPVFRTRAADYFGHPTSGFLGVRTPIVRKVSGHYFGEIKSLSMDRILELCEAFLDTGLSEYRTIAFDWAYRCRKQYCPEHFAVFERWLGKLR
jgi:hypothetical protein